MEFTRTDLDFGLRQLGLDPAEQLVVNADGIVLSFADETDVYRFWVALARNPRRDVDVDELLSTVDIDEDTAGRITLSFSGVRVSSGANGASARSTETTGTATDNDRVAGLEATVNQLSETVSRLTELAERHLGHRA